MPLQKVNLPNPDSLTVLPRASQMENGTIIYWMQFYRQALKSDAPTLVPQGLFFKVGTSAQCWIIVLKLDIMCFFVWFVLGCSKWLGDAVRFSSPLLN